MMEWNKQEQQLNHQNVGGGSGIYVKVMTDEQMELLRRQISVYATICDQLVEMHNAFAAQQHLAGMRLAGLYYDPLVTLAGHKITARQRWTPTSVQLQILERIFSEGIGTPDKQKTKEITAKLSQHGQISETNVYNWFQNRRARSKRKKLFVAPNNAESEVEVETEVESPKEKNVKLEITKSHEKTSQRAEDIYFQDPEMSAEMHCIDALYGEGVPMFPSDHDLRSSGSFGHLALYDSVPGIEQFIGKKQIPGSFSPYQQREGYDMV